MNKSTIIVKKLLALFLVVLMSIESFGAIVSDNDGSAFITKAEFDSKVNEFNAEINRYETSIDAKLQGAVASYIEGVLVQEKPVVLLNRIKTSIGNKNPYFMNSVTGAGTSSLTTALSVSKEKSYSYRSAFEGKKNTTDLLFHWKRPESYAASTYRQTSSLNSLVYFYFLPHANFIAKNRQNSYGRAAGYTLQSKSGAYTNAWKWDQGNGGIYDQVTNQSWGTDNQSVIHLQLPTVSNSKLKLYVCANDTGVFPDVALGEFETGKTHHVYIMDYYAANNSFSLTQSYIGIYIDGGCILKDGAEWTSLNTAYSNNYGAGVIDHFIYGWKDVYDPTTKTTNYPNWSTTMTNVQFISLSSFTSSDYSTFKNGMTATLADGAAKNDLHTSVPGANKQRNGSGSAWEYTTTLSGARLLKNYYSSIYPLQLANLSYKSYQDHTGTPFPDMEHVDEESLNDDQTGTYSPSQSATWGRTTYGTKYTAYNTANKVGYLEQILINNKSSTDTRDYRAAQWGNNTTQTIYAVADTQQPVKTSTNLASSYTNLEDLTVSLYGKNHKVKGVTNNVYEMKLNPTAYQLNTFQNEVYSAIAGEPVYLGYGIPIMSTRANNSAKYTVNLGVKQTVAPAGTAAASGNVTARLSRNHFVNGGFATASDKVWEGTISCNSSGVGTVTFTFEDIPKNQQLWLNLYGTTASRIVEVTNFNVTMS